MLEAKKTDAMLGEIVERGHEFLVGSLHRLGCPPEFVVLYDALPRAATLELAWAAIREKWRLERGRLLH